MLRSALGLLAAALVGLAAPARARPLDEVMASKVLRVIAYEDNEPFSWSAGDTADAVRGIDVEVARALAARLGVEAEVILRPPGENLDQDLRVNVVRGTIGGGIAGDIMLHVPVDKDLALRNREVVIANAYFQQQVALAAAPGRTGEITSFEVFKAEKVGVQLGTVADYFLMRFEDGALVNNISHYLKPGQGVARLAKGEVTALLGVRSSLEALLKASNQQATWSTPPMPGLVRGSWVLGTAVNERSRDLSYAIGAALRDMAADGTLKTIYEKYGVTYLPPAEP